MWKGLSLVLPDPASAEACVRLAAEAGFDGVEPTFSPTGYPRFDRLPEDADDLRAAADRAGLRLPSMRGGPLFWTTFCDPDPAGREQTLANGRRALDCLRRMGGDVLLVVPGRQTDGVDPEAQWGWAVDLARRLGDEAEARGAVIGLENVEGLFPPTLEAWERLLSEIDHPHVGIYLDIGNLVRLERGDPLDWIDRLRPWIRRVHVKGAVAGKGAVRLGDGEVNWPAVTARLRAIGYDGWIVTEPAQPETLDEAFVTDCHRRLAGILSGR